MGAPWQPTIKAETLCGSGRSCAKHAALKGTPPSGIKSGQRHPKCVYGLG
jgi:hypothetical protein